MLSEWIEFTVQDGIATLTLRDPARLNALTLDLMRPALRAVQRLQDDRSVRVLVLRSVGRVFCAGAHLGDFPPDGGTDARGRRAPEIVDELLSLGNAMVTALRELPVPVLAVVQGVAVGGGVGLALAADMVVAARSAAFQCPFVPALGLVPDMASSWVMQRAIGAARTTGWLLLGDRLSAEQAARDGLIWACVDDDRLDDAAADLARRLAALPPGSVAAVRSFVQGAPHHTLAQQLHHEQARQRAAVGSSAFEEGLRAFAEKRRPQFDTR